MTATRSMRCGRGSARFRHSPGGSRRRLRRLACGRREGRRRAPIRSGRVPLVTTRRGDHPRPGRVRRRDLIGGPPALDSQLLVAALLVVVVAAVQEPSLHFEARQVVPAWAGTMPRAWGGLDLHGFSRSGPGDGRPSPGPRRGGAAAFPRQQAHPPLRQPPHPRASDDHPLPAIPPTRCSAKRQLNTGRGGAGRAGGRRITGHDANDRRSRGRGTVSGVPGTCRAAEP